MPTTRLRKEFDGDTVTGPVPTDYRTETNQFEVQCGTCGKQYYVDAATRDELERDLEHDVEAPFICVECQEAEFDELQYR
jgi:hypothetical protein